MLVDGQHSLFSTTMCWIQSSVKTQPCCLTSVHTPTNIPLLSASSVRVLHTKLNQNSCGLLARDYGLFRKLAFTVINLSRVSAPLKRKLSLKCKDILFPFSPWNPKPKETQTPIICIKCKYMNRETDKAKLQTR